VTTVDFSPEEDMMLEARIAFTSSAAAVLASAKTPLVSRVDPPIRQVRAKLRRMI
jgi:hypothetical protein